MHNTRKQPGNFDTLVPSRQQIHEVNHHHLFEEARDYYEMGISNIKGWQKVPPAYVRRGEKPTPESERWPRGIASEAIYNMAAEVGRERALEAIWFVASILHDNPSYFVYDTRNNRHDTTALGMISRANGFCRFVGSPRGRIMRKYSGRAYQERY